MAGSAPLPHPPASLKGDGTGEAGVSKLVPLVNKLREAFAVMRESPIDLPMIAVVGSQSAGKSSVLENIVGHSFLPRGSGIVTRCPCEIRMHCSRGESFAMFPSSESPSRKYTNFEDVRDMIAKETVRLAGKHGLSSTSIVVDIHSPDLLDLTLVDLPGAVRTVVDGQDPNIIHLIDRMITDYIVQPNCIILAVSAANTDLANSDAIAYSRKVDPEGLRTLAVLTKLDLMDEGTDASDIITGENPNMPRLKLGYIGVVNRSQKDISERRTIQEARQKEMEFFSGHAAYYNLTSHLGTRHLVERCSQLLVQTIQREIPQVDAKLKDLIAKKEQELKALPNVSTENLRMLYQKLVRDFREQFTGLINGAVDMPDEELEGGARIKNLFDVRFLRKIMSLTLKDLDSMDVQFQRKLRIMIKNKKGLRGGLNTPNDAFHALVSKQVEMTELPSVACAMDVLHEMQRIQKRAMDNVRLFESFPKARAALIQTSNEILTKKHERTVEYLRTLVKMNMRHISYEHPDFDKETILYVAQSRFAREHYGYEDTEEEQELMRRAHSGAKLSDQERARVRAIMERRSLATRARPAEPVSASLRVAEPALDRSASYDIKIPDKASLEEELEIEKLLALTRGYFSLIQKQVVDLVPKYIDLLLVEESREEICDKIESLSDSEVQDLMTPSDDVMVRREEAQKALVKLNEAQQLLFSVSRMDTTVDS